MQTAADSVYYTRNLFLKAYKKFYAKIAQALAYACIRLTVYLKSGQASLRCYPSRNARRINRESCYYYKYVDAQAWKRRAHYFLHN